MTATGSTLAEADLRIAKANINDLLKQLAEVVSQRDELHLQLYKSVDLRKYFQIVNCDCDIVNYDSYIVKLDYATPGSEIVNFDYATPGSEIVNFDYATPGSEIVNFLTISDPGVA